MRSRPARLVEPLLRAYRSLKERAGLAPGFSDAEVHRWMLADEARLDAFERALRLAVRPGSVVADVGAGTGILSFMACRAGAARVYAVEETPIIGLAETLARDNGCADRIVFLRGRSTAVSLPERADVVVSETIGAFVFSEEILATMADARRRFLAPGGVLIPGRIVVRAAPVESYREGIGFWERPVRGFDFGAAASWVDVSGLASGRHLSREDFLAAEDILYDLDFGAAGPEMDFARTLRFRAARRGVLHGFVGFWDVQLHGDAILKCAPGDAVGNWPAVLFRLRKGLPVDRGDEIRLAFDRRDRPGWSWTWDAEVRRA